MGDNVTFFGDVADDFDVQLRQAESALDRYVETSRYSTSSMVLASTTFAFMRFGQSFVDVLRIGNGIAQGGWKGYGTDAMRLLSAGGVAGAVVGRLSRILVVTQQAGTFTCTWISTANALRRTGQRFFASVPALADATGVDLAEVEKAGGTFAQQFTSLISALKKMGAAVDEVTPASAKIEAVGDLLKAKPNGALAFAIEYQSGGRTAGHQLFATYSRTAGLVITDTTGKLYRSFKALNDAYPAAKLFLSHMAYLNNTAIISGASAADTAGGLSQLVMELLPIAFKEKIQPAARGR